MRVLQVHARYRERGGEDAVVDADRVVLTDAGHEVEQYTPANPAAAGSALASLAASGWNVAAQKRVGAAIDRFRPDVMHVHNTWFSLTPAVLRAARIRNLPTVLTVHNFRLVCANGLFMRDGSPCEDCLHHGSYNAVKHSCYRNSRGLSAVAAAGIAVHRQLGTWCELVDRFLLLSEFAESRLSTAGIPPDKIIRGSNYVNDPGHRPEPPSHSRDVLFLGRISPEKGLSHLLEAWRLAQPRTLRLSIVGDGPQRDDLEATAPEGVAFVGRVAKGEVQARLLTARAVVVPSVWYEGQPIVALEAMACGVPLVLSDIGGLPEVLGGRAAGWLCAPGSPEVLAERLASLEDDVAVDERGGQARARYEEAFTPEAAGPRLEAAYSSAGAKT